MTNERFILGLKSGDNNIIKEIYESNLPTVTSWIKKNNGSEDDALDIFQEGIESIITKIFQAKIPEKINFNAYLFTICKNKWYDNLKEKKRDERVRDEELERYVNEYQDEQVFVGNDNKAQMKLMLDETFANLSPKCRQVLSLLESGLSPAEVAQQLNMSSANTVYRRKFACYESWKKLVLTHHFYALWKV